MLFIRPSLYRWHCFNDRIVSDIDEASVQSAHAYLLFYVRRDVKSADVSSLFPRTNTEAVDASKISGSRVATAATRCAVM